MPEPQSRVENITYESPWPNRQGYYEDVQGNRRYTYSQTAAVRRDRTDTQTRSQWRRIMDNYPDSGLYDRAYDAYRRTEGAMRSRRRWNLVNRW